MRTWEKNLRYFFNLEKRNFTNKVITKIIEDDRHASLTTDEILDSQKTYFKTLYSENNAVDNNQIKTLIGGNHWKLTENEDELLEGDIKYSELAEALKIHKKKYKNTSRKRYVYCRIFKFYWTDLRYFKINSLTFGFRTGVHYQSLKNKA